MTTLNDPEEHRLMLWQKEILNFGQACIRLMMENNFTDASLKELSTKYARKMRDISNADLYPPDPDDTDDEHPKPPF